MQTFIYRLRATKRLLTAALAGCAVLFSAPAHAQTCNTHQCTIDLTPTIYLNNNEWGNTTGQYGTGSITRNSSTSWSTSWNFSGGQNYSVLTYANACLGWFYGYRDAGTGLPFQLSANTPVYCTAQYNVTGTFQGDVAYDFWADVTTNPTTRNPDHEIMIWVKCAGVGPSDPIVATPTIDGVTWDCHQSRRGGRTSFLLNGGGNSYDLMNQFPSGYTINAMDFMNWMISQGMIASSEYLLSVPFGVEVDCTPSFPAVNGTLNVTYYSAAVGAPTMPAAPTGLAATGGNGQVSLTWNASSGATSYNVLRSTVNGSGYAAVASVGAASTSYTNTGLANGVTYYYVVTASNLAGTSGNSNQASATTVLTAPAAPTGVTATVGNTKITVAWAASSSATSYNVKRSNVSGGPYTTVGSPTGTSFVNSGLTNGTTYYYVVSAVNSIGESANSSQVSATPNPPPAPPTNLISSKGNAQVTLAWTLSVSPGVTYQNVYHATVSGGPYQFVKTAGATETKVNVSEPSGQTRYFVVTAVNAGGESAYSNETSQTPR